MTADHEVKLGTYSHLALFAWSIFLVMLAPARLLPWLAAICLTVAIAVYRRSFHKIVRFHWLAMLVLLALPPVFFVGELDRNWAGIPYSSTGLLTAVQIAVRLVVVLIYVDGFTSSVDISSIGGLFERAGLRGLGFSIGVAFNLLPALQQSSLTAWRSLWMRGGLRKKRWRGIRLLTITVVGNAITRAEEIALAAEARAYAPEKSRALPVKKGRWDRAIGITALVTLIGIILYSRFIIR